jgi:hypothetical protein
MHADYPNTSLDGHCPSDARELLPSSHLFMRDRLAGNIAAAFDSIDVPMHSTVLVLGSVPTGDTEDTFPPFGSPVNRHAI